MIELDNAYIGALLDETARLMELNGENAFKTRAYQKAALAIEQFEGDLSSAVQQGLNPDEIPGVGKSIAANILEILNAGGFAALYQLRLAVPEGVVEMVRLPGLGVKKTQMLWREHHIDSLEALREAGVNGRLANIKGFGAKTQAHILEAIDLLRRARRQLLLPAARRLAEQISAQIMSIPDVRNVTPAGALRRCCPVVDILELVVTVNDAPAVHQALTTLFEPIEGDTQTVRFASTHGAPVICHLTSEAAFTESLWRATTWGEHLHALEQYAAGVVDEAEIYMRAGKPFLPPELRENRGELTLTELPPLVEPADLKGVVHAHSTWSDGAHTLRAMAEACRREGYAYICITDHSQSAFYANGLNPKRVQEQHREIDALNIELAPFRIFKGIESDILADGNLDYDEEILAAFDCVIASVHSGLRMDVAKATERLVRAVCHPRTAILGHPTGRLLLRREGYPIDHRAVIDACAAHGVAIELNCNPRRMDLDWTWLPHAVEKGVRISINPDAHHTSEIDYLKDGVAVARKGMLTKAATLNALSVEAFETWLKNRVS